MACHHHCATSTDGEFSGAYRRILWIVFGLNAAMFLVEIAAGWRANSVSLLADSLDFLGDSANYLISLIVLGKALQLRAKAALFKGLSMGVVGIWVLVTTLYHLLQGEMPSYGEMGVIGTLACLANLLSAWLLYRFREGDSNMQSVWLCSRNDAIGNLAVIAAAVAVYFTQSRFPDLLVALIMVWLSLSASKTVIQQALGELKGEC
ncbi:Co/Zn/Cd efflux system component [Cricetibacter osteomyelitidis]|uniref:Co/Zn/Cd efflux system component n=1 Tax=Cricetibacter osteomyelitidis TaxID=1521931 RepID=A0A4R2T314_9PAST|nr:cation diffusion facilitator family transporter [Cricetibacter osteomyelitidis]TCP97319.1 Co/Zn/Cd efflux system component [Cricetibacter osteomyelitidis]